MSTLVAVVAFALLFTVFGVMGARAGCDGECRGCGSECRMAKGRRARRRETGP